MEPCDRCRWRGNVFGTGTCGSRANSTIGVFGDNFGSNSIGNNLNLGGGTQIVRASNGSFIDFRALQFSGVLSNASFLRPSVYGEWHLGTTGRHCLYGNNTYTGLPPSTAAEAS
jgi:hypothetical protein